MADRLFDICADMPMLPLGMRPQVVAVVDLSPLVPEHEVRGVPRKPYLACIGKCGWGLVFNNDPAP